VLSGTQNKKPSKKEQQAAKVIAEAPVIDISCIFDEEPEVKDKSIVVVDGEHSLNANHLKTLTVRELRELAKGQKINRSYKLSKAELVKKLAVT
jgi:hypothetical protein